MPNDRRTKRIEKREDRRSKFKNPEPIDNQQITDLKQKVSNDNIETPANDTRAPRTAAGFKIAPVGGIKDRKTKKPTTVIKPTKEDNTASNQSVINSIKSNTYSKFPEEDVFGIDEKFNPEVTGGGYDDNGNSITSGTQVLNAIISDKDPKNRKSITQVSEELGAASEYKNVLSEEQVKAKSLQYALDPDEQKLEEIEGLISPYGSKYANVQNISVNDIINETSAIVNDGDMTDPESRGRLEKLLQEANKTPINYGEPALERLGLQDYYPDINAPLQVGTYSGSIVGSNPIFVAGGGVIPVSIIDARKRALERAAAERIKKGEKLKELILVPSPEQYQDKFHEMGLEIFNEYGDKVGWDYAKLMDMNDPIGKEFNQKYAAYDANAKRAMKVQAQYDATIKEYGDDKEGTWLPPQVRAIMDRWQSGAWSTEELLDSKLLEEASNIFDVYDQMTQDAYELAKEIKPDAFFGRNGMPETDAEWAEFDQEMEKVNSSNGYNVWRTTEFKWVDPKRIVDAATLVSEKRHYYNPEETKNDLIHLTTTLIGKEAKANYLSKAEGNRTSVNINNATPVAQTEEIRLRANQDEWKGFLFNTIGKQNNDKEIADNMTNIMDMTPILDNEGKFKNGEIRGDIKVVNKDNDVLPVNFGNVKFYDKNTGKSYNYIELQQNILSKKAKDLGLPADLNEFNSLVSTWKKNRPESGDRLLNEALVDRNGEFAKYHFTTEEALILSKNDQSNIFGRITTKSYAQKYQDESGNWKVLKTSDNPNLSQGSQPYIDETYSMYDEISKADNVFGGYEIRYSYNLNNRTGDQGAAEAGSVPSTKGENTVKKQNEVIGMDSKTEVNKTPLVKTNLD